MMAKCSNEEVSYLSSKELVFNIDNRLPPPSGVGMSILLLSKMQLNPSSVML